MVATKQDYDKLLDAAMEAAGNSYSPYSQFPVGAALLTDAGEIVTGCNVENASYGGTICAERTAIVKAVSQGHRKFQAIAVACVKNPEGWPCGMCRQVLREFGTDIDIVVKNAGGKVEIIKLSELLPHSFGPDSLR